jgi:ribosome maturation factor RimP
MLGDSTHLRQILEPTVEGMGFELVMVELVGRGNKTLRLYIDAPGGVVLDDCESVSRQVGALLDVEDPIPGQYTLEVSSPGLDRPLVTRGHFERFVGAEVQIRTTHHHLGRRRFTGTLQSVDTSGVVVDVDGENYALPFADMESARLVVKI